MTDVTPEPFAMTRAQKRWRMRHGSEAVPPPAAASRPGVTEDQSAVSVSLASEPATGSKPAGTERPGSPQPGVAGEPATASKPGVTGEPATASKPAAKPHAGRAMTRARKRATAAEEPTVDPIPEMPLQPLVTIAVLALAGLLTISAFAGPVLVAVAVALAAGVMAWGWSGLLGLPSPRGTAFVLAVGSAGAIGTALATRSDPFLAWMPAAFAGAMIVEFVHQLARRDGRPRLVESVASTITALAIVVSGSSLVTLPRTPQGAWIVALAASAMAVSALTDLIGRSRRLRNWLLPLAMLAGGAVAILVGVLLGDVGWGPSLLIGVLAAGISHAVRRALAMLPSISGPRSQLVGASASVLTGGVVAYVVGRFFLG